MGLPRHLSNAFRDVMKQSTPMELIYLGMRVGVIVAAENIHHKINYASKRRDLSADQELQAAFKWAWRQLHNPRSTTVDELTRESARLYVGLEEDRDESDCYNIGSFRNVQIPRYFKKRLEVLNHERQEIDREEFRLRERIAEVRARVYASRKYPSALRAIIFARDNYTCQVCLRNRAALLLAGLHLECDHILAWEDGGKTTYENGQTICCDCNKAKHHSKSYLGMVSRFRRAG